MVSKNRIPAKSYWEKASKWHFVSKQFTGGIDYWGKYFSSDNETLKVIEVWKALENPEDEEAKSFWRNGSA
jgi:hypothetical protein